MCVYSMIVDTKVDEWRRRYPWTVPADPKPWTWPTVRPQVPDDEVAEFRELLKRAREYDKAHNQPDCDLEDKKETLLQLAELLGVEIDFV